MNFSAIIAALCLLVGAAIVAPTASAASIDTYPNFFSSDQIKHFASVDVDGEGAEEVFNKAFGDTLPPSSSPTATGKGTKSPKKTRSPKSAKSAKSSKSSPAPPPLGVDKRRPPIR